MATQKKPKTFSLISRRKLLALYRALLRCRVAKERSSKSVRRNAAAFDAAAVAATIDLGKGDMVYAAASELLNGLTLGTATLASERFRSVGRNSSLKGALTAALQAARAHAQVTQRKRRNVAVVFAAGASASSVPWRDAMRIAGEERLPIVFVSFPIAGSPPSRARAGLKLPAIPVDRDDVVALYRVASEALAHARRGNGPTLIECIRWPFAPAHNGAKAASDSILNMESYLAQRGIRFERSKKKTLGESQRS